MRRRKKNKGVSQIRLFKVWLAENKDKFICKPKEFYCKPRYKKDRDYLHLRYEGIINNIEIVVDDYSFIDVKVMNLVGLECVDILFDCSVSLRTNEEGKYYNYSYLEQYRKYYDNPEQVFNDEFEQFLNWSNELISDDKLLYVYNCYNSMSMAKLITTEQLPDWKPKETKESISKVVPIKKQVKIKSL